jgi:ABC-type glycerol-3-phosphate transport system substrate-binding protein
VRRKAMKRLTTVVTMLLLITAWTALAGPQSESGAAASGERVSLLAWWTVRKPIMDYSKEELKKFESRHPNIQVELLGIPEDALQQKLIGAVKAKTGPDVVYIDENTVKVMYNAGVLQPIPESVHTEQELLKMYGPKAQMSKLGGKYYGFPNGDMAAVLFYNIDLLKQHGLDPEGIPNTWTELMALAQKMTDLANDVQGFPIRGREASMWNALLYQNGGFVFRNEKEAMFAEKPGEDAFGFLLDIYDRYKVSSRTSLSAQEAFGQGKAPFVYNWTWYIGTVLTTYPDIQFGTRVLPTQTGKPPFGSYGPSYGLFVSCIDSRKLPAAWELWKYVISPDFQLGWAMLRGLIPARLEAQKPDIFGKSPYKAIGEAAQNGITLDFYPDEINKLVLGTMVDEVMNGAPIMATMRKVQDQVNGFLKEHSQDCWIYGKTWYDRAK